MTAERNPLPGLPFNRFVAARRPDGSLTFDQTALPAIRDADVVIGRNLASGHEFIVFGREILQRLAAIKAPERHKFVVVEVDPNQDGDQTSALVALVTALKGRNDFRPGLPR
jgi:hypothetical protein